MPNIEPKTLDERLIGEIVREVLVRVAPANSKPQSSNTTLVLTESVVGAKALADRLAGVTNVVLSRKAILTPAARDLLREHKIAITYSTNQAAAKHSLAIAIADTTYDAATLVRAIGPLVTGIDRLASTGLIGAIDELCDAVTKGGQLGLLFTTNRHAALCLANRHAGIRAITPKDRLEVRETIDTLGANLAVIDPRGQSFFQIQQIVQEFVRGGLRQCPTSLQERLG